jgi:peptide/nickel transport system substrate-binding protein
MHTKTTIENLQSGARQRSPDVFYGLSTLAFCATFAISPCVAGAQNAPRDPGGTLVIAHASDLQSMNSLVNAEGWSTDLMVHALFLPLVRFAPDWTYVPALAQSWTMQGDTAVVFRIRRDVFWHDGKRTSAHDVAFTFDRIKDEETASPEAETFTNWKTAQVIDSFTVRFSLKPHVDPFSGLPLLSIMPKHLLDSIPSARLRQAAFNKNPVGNGPFRFVSQRANDRWVFEANPRFPAALGGRPRLDRLIWRVIPENTAQVTEIIAGQADVITAPRAEQVRQLDARADMRAIFRPTLRYAMIAWNGKRAPLNDVRVRRALGMALDRQKMITALRGGYAQRAASPVPSFHWAYDNAVQPLPYDTAGARKLLEAAGYRDRDRDGIVKDAKGKRLELELKVAANNAFNKDLGEMVRAELDRVGVRINVRPVDFATMIDDISKPTRNFEGAFLMFQSDYRLSFRDAFHSSAMEGPFQSASYRNAELDALLDKADVTSDRAAARKVWSRAQRILRDEQPWTFLWWAPDMIVARERVKGIEMDARGAFRTIGQWSIER